MKHNHITRDIKKMGECPACDEYIVDQIKKQAEELTKLSEEELFEQIGRLLDETKPQRS